MLRPNLRQTSYLKPTGTLKQNTSGFKHISIMDHAKSRGTDSESKQTAPYHWHVTVVPVGTTTGRYSKLSHYSTEVCVSPERWIERKQRTTEKLSSYVLVGSTGNRRIHQTAVGIQKGNILPQMGSGSFSMFDSR
jgi:hypothetical protein